MVLYYLRNYITLGKSPKEMIDPNTRTDYNKMKKLIQLDKLDGNRKGVLRKITEEGQIITNLITTFPAKEIAKPEIFPSLLFYYGMLTITATRGSRLVLSIPNYNVRKQYYEFMLEEYQDKRHINLNNLMDLFDEMAYEGHWRENTGIHCPCLQGKFICTQCHGRRAKYTGFLHRLPQRKRLLPDGSGNGTEPRLLRPLPHAGPDALRGEA